MSKGGRGHVMRATPPSVVPGWLRGALAASGVHGIGWGAAAIIAPAFVFRRADLPLPNYPQLWQCLGAFVTIFGIGALIASRDPVRHWPVVLMGLMAKIAVPVGCLVAWRRGEFPTPALGALLVNDVIWWVPFTMLLWYAARDYAAGDLPRSPLRLAPRDAMAHAVSDDGSTLLELSERKRQLVVFLRHGGCTFCKEALADLRTHRDAIEAAGVDIVLVHMGMPEDGETLVERAGLQGVAVISDPLRQLYQSFQLEQGSFGALFGPKVMLRGLSATWRGHILGPLEGDGLQMPGAFVVWRGAVLRSFRHATAADRPDYVALACGDCELEPPSAA